MFLVQGNECLPTVQICQQETIQPYRGFRLHSFTPIIGHWHHPVASCTQICWYATMYQAIQELQIKTKQSQSLLQPISQLGKLVYYDTNISITTKINRMLFQLNRRKTKVSRKRESFPGKLASETSSEGRIRFQSTEIKTFILQVQNEKDMKVKKPDMLKKIDEQFGLVEW